ncbi:MAG: 30S ribosomal protein S4e [Candidatus Thorarchaeota archaeon]|nr:30S ribosomal protein S4e [Candidatus Thorarchaeota archaeon]
MTRLGQKKQLKRLPAPAHWPISRKSTKFTIRPRPGPHPKDSCIPIGILLREVMGYAHDMREIRKILTAGQVKVDGRTVKQAGFPLGVMDVITVESSGQNFRILPRTDGKLVPVPIQQDEAGFKVCRIQSKRMVKGGAVQLSLHDGRCLLLPKDHNPEDYRLLDSLKILVPDQHLVSKFPLEKGAHVIITRGKNVGIQGKVVQVEKRYGTFASIVTVEDLQGKKVQTALQYVFVVGSNKPEVTLISAGGAKE